MDGSSLIPTKHKISRSMCNVCHFCFSIFAASHFYFSRNLGKPPLKPKPIQLKLYIVWCLSEILKSTDHANCFRETESGSIESIDGQTLRHEWSPCFWISSTLSISTRLSIAFKYRILPTTTWGQQSGESPCYFMVLHDQQIMNHSLKTQESACFLQPRYSIVIPRHF